MEVALIIIFGALAYICWNMLAIKDGVETINARLNNINIELMEHREMLNDLKKINSKGNNLEIKKHFK